MTAVPHEYLDVDRPRAIAAGMPASDRIFRNATRIVGSTVMIVTGAIGLFLGAKVFPTIHRYGFGFFTQAQFVPDHNLVGIGAAVVGTVVIGLIALTIAFPIALLTALYISEYAPARARSLLISVIDLMAAIPSIVYGVWGYFLLMPHALYVSHWISEWFGWIPIFKVKNANPRAASLLNGVAPRYDQSAFIAGMVVALMVIPLACSLMRNVFSQAPLGEREGAYALGATRWGMIRSVVLPFGRGGIIGATMLGLGRALGETVAVLLILSLAFDIKIRILENGSVTISSLIANDFEGRTGSALNALLAAGFVLFMMTLIVNTLAGMVVSRSRSGAGVDL